MDMPKPSEADKQRFRKAMPDHPDVVVKPMFGNLGGFVNGNMFAGLFGPVLGIKLAPEDKSELENAEATVPFGPAERPMGGYTGLPEAWQDGSHNEETAAWVGKAFEYIATLPPKAPKSPKAPRNAG